MNALAPSPELPRCSACMYCHVDSFTGEELCGSPELDSKMLACIVRGTAGLCALGARWFRSAVLIRVYDSDGNTRITVKPEVGDVVEYKRNGRRGCMRCKVEAITHGADPRLRLRADGAERAFSVPVDSRGFSALYRGGHRVYKRAA